MQRERSAEGLSPPVLDVGLKELEKGLFLPVTGEGILQEAFRSLVNSGQGSLEAQHGLATVASSLTSDRKVSDGWAQMASLMKRQHELIGLIGARAATLGGHEL